MKKSRFFLLLLFGCLTSNSTFAQTAISAISIIQTSRQAEVRIESTQEINPRIFTLEQPDRLVVDLSEKITFDTKLQFDSGQWVQTIRTAGKNNGSRLVLDLAKKLQHREIFVEEGGKAAFIIELSAGSPPHANPAVPASSNSNADAQLGSDSAFGISATGRDLIVVIDPGHGGRDPGAQTTVSGEKLLEKRIVLSVAHRLANYLRRTKGIKVLMTRETDVYIPLRSRYALARKNEADVFVSIHADAALNSSARGASVYVLSKKGGVSPLERFLEERANVELEDVNNRIAGIQLEDEEDFNKAVAELASVATERVSFELANLMLSNFAKANIRRLRSTPGTANFVVLRAPDVPSILVEIGFLTHNTDAKNLGWSKYRDDLAKSLFFSIRKHLIDHASSDAYLAVADPTFIEYEVQQGDSVSELAQVFGSSIKEILQNNKLPGGFLQVGQFLRIPL